jgi:hypothetical protein
MIVATMALLLAFHVAPANASSASPHVDTQTSAKWGAGNGVQRNVAFIAKEFVELVEAMPDDKFTFAPTADGDFKGTRTFGQQVLHVANANFELAGAVMGKKFSPDPNRATTKAELVPYLKSSFEELQNAAASLTAQNATDQVENPFGGGEAPYGGTPDRLGMIIMAATHDRDHYGQLALYLRMNQIIPPASRKK